jgi:hypothetical protein
MEMQQMLELSLANQEKKVSDRKAYREALNEINANMKSQEEKCWPECKKILHLAKQR